MSMFWLSLSSACMVLRLSLPYSVSLASRLGMSKKLGEGTAETADPNRPKGYYVPYNIVLGNKNWGKVDFGEVAIAWRMAGHWSTCGRWWVTASIVSWVSFFSFLQLLDCVCLHSWVFSLLLFLFSSPSLWGGEWASGCEVLRCWLGSTTTIIENKIMKFTENTKFGNIKSVPGYNLCLRGSWRWIIWFLSALWNLLG